MSGDDRKVSGVRAQLLVLLEGEPDDRRAATVTALADEGHQLRPSIVAGALKMRCHLLDLLIRRPKATLVLGHSLLPRLHWSSPARAGSHRNDWAADESCRSGKHSVTGDWLHSRAVRGRPCLAPR